MGFHRHRDGETFQRNWTPSIQGHQCYESWNSEKKRWQMYHALQCGFIEHRTLVSHNSLSKSAQHPRKQFQADVKSSLNGLRIKKSRLWRSSRQKKWILWCKLQGATLGHLETDCENVFRDMKHWRNSNYESLWRCDIREKCLHWDELQNGSCRRLWFGRPNISMQRIHTSSRWSKLKNLCKVLHIIPHDILTSAQLKFRLLPPQRKIEIPGWWYAEGKTATWSYISTIQTTIPQVLNCWST